MATLQPIIIALVAFAGVASASPIAIANTTTPALYDTRLETREHFPPSKTLNETGIDCFGRWHSGYMSVFHVSILHIPDQEISDLCGGLWDNLHAFDGDGCTVDDGLHYCGHRQGRNSGLKWVFETNSDCPRTKLAKAFKLATDKKYGALTCRPNWDSEWEAHNRFPEDLLNAPPDGPPFEGQLNAPGGGQTKRFPLADNSSVVEVDEEESAHHVVAKEDGPGIIIPVVNQTTTTSTMVDDSVGEVVTEHDGKGKEE